MRGKISGNASDILVLDVETPNLKNDSICSIGLVRIHDGVIEEPYYSLINPETYFNDKNIEIHGITKNDVRSAPLFPDIWKQFEEDFNSCILAAHNASFDLGVINKSLARYGLPFPSVNYLCTLEMSRLAFKGLSSYSLSTLCDLAKIPLDHHCAKSDSLACANLLKIFIDSGMPIDRFISEYHFNKIPKQEYCCANPSESTKLLRELIDFLESACSEGQLSAQHIFALENWLRDNNALCGNYPFDRVCTIVSDVLADGRIDCDEIGIMTDLFQELCDPVAAASTPCGQIDVTDKNIVLTGEFDFGERLKIQYILNGLGAKCQKSVNKATDYLVVGGQGSSAWCAGNYGTKVKKALEMQSKGSPIVIIRENEFFVAVGGIYGTVNA